MKVIGATANYRKMRILREFSVSSSSAGLLYFVHLSRGDMLRKLAKKGTMIPSADTHWGVEAALADGVKIVVFDNETEAQELFKKCVKQLAAEVL